MPRCFYGEIDKCTQSREKGMTQKCAKFDHEKARPCKRFVFFLFFSSSLCCWFAASLSTDLHILVRFSMYQSSSFYHAHQFNKMLWNNILLLHRNLFEIVYFARPSPDSFCLAFLSRHLFIFICCCKFLQMFFVFGECFFLFLSRSLPMHVGQIRKIYDECCYFFVELLICLFASNENEISICFSICFSSVPTKKKKKTLWNIAKQTKPNYVSTKRDRICFVDS